MHVNIFIMTNLDKMADELQQKINNVKKEIEIESLCKQLDDAIIKNLQIKDSEGFVFLTNQDQNNINLPFDLARQYGFKLPIFKVTEPEFPDECAYQYSKGLSDEQVSRFRYIFSIRMHGVWVKEGLK